MDTPYDSSWDDGNEELWEQKYEEWTQRDREEWLRKHLSFPFEVRREEDDDDTFFTDVAQREPFRLGHVMRATALDEDDPKYGMLIQVQEGKKTGYVPLCDVEVTSRTDANFWPVREDVVWFANR